jgi:hypothetical protein
MSLAIAQRSRVAIVVAVVAANACGSEARKAGDAAPGPIVETYTMSSATRFVTTATTGGTPGGYIDLTTSSSGVSFTGYDTVGSQLHAFTGFVPRLLRYPVVLDDTWSYTMISNGNPVTAQIRVQSATETVTVPAGTFTGCAVTVETITAPASAGSKVRTFAPGVGPVRVVATSSDGSVAHGELQSYSVSGAASDLFPLTVNNAWTFRWQ